MDREPIFELSGMHDESSAAATAKVLFQRFWRSKLVLFVGVSLTLTLVGAIWAWYYVKIATGFWIFGGLIGLEVASLIHVRWRIRRSLKTRIGKSIQVRLTADDLSWNSGAEAHTVPWSRFKSVSTDAHNLYLFFTRTLVLVIPNQRDPQEAARFAVSRLSGGHLT